MIEPKWLEQTFIVSNRAESPKESILDEISLDDESLDIKTEPYRNFVQKHPNEVSYFQPILDRLEVTPSRLDLQTDSVILEGKSDYYILRYAAQHYGIETPPLIPGLGAGTFGALIALHLGWNSNFVALLDGDKQGDLEKDRYVAEFGIPLHRIIQLHEITTSANEIENVLDANARDIIKMKIESSGKITKNQIRRFFQESIASENTIELGENFEKECRSIIDGIRKKLKNMN